MFSLRAFLGWLLLATACLGPALQAPAQTVGVSVSVTPRRIGVGDEAMVLLKVINGKASDLPQTVTADGLKITLLPDTNSSYKMINGVTSSEIHYYYRVIGEREGRLTVPPIPLSVNGQATVTDPLTLEVIKRKPGDLTLDASKPYFLRLECAQTEIYEGQSVPIKITVYSRSNINQINPPDVQVSDNGQLKAFAKELEQTNVDIDGYTFITASLSGEVTGLRPGELLLGPANMGVKLMESNDLMGGFGRSLFTQSVLRQLASNALTLQVMPLPAEGRPASFRSGSVGAFEVALEASPKELQAGDPLSIELTVSGVGNLDSVEAPLFQPANAEDWRVFEPKKTVVGGRDGKPGQAIFSQVVIPRRPVTELPSFEFGFFDPKTAAYGVRRTQPVPLRVTQDAALTAAAPGGNGGAPQPLIPGAPGTARMAPLDKPRPDYPDILHISSLPLKLAPPPRPVLATNGFWLAQIPPALALFGLAGWGAWRRLRESSTHRPRKAMPENYRTLRHRLDEPGVRASRLAFLQAAAACLDHLRSQPHSPEVGRDLGHLNARIQQELYGPQSRQSPETPLPEPDALDITRSLDQLSPDRRS